MKYLLDLTKRSSMQFTLQHNASPFHCPREYHLVAIRLSELYDVRFAHIVSTEYHFSGITPSLKPEGSNNPVFRS